MQNNELRLKPKSGQAQLRSSLIELQIVIKLEFLRVYPTEKLVKLMYKKKITHHMHHMAEKFLKI